MSIGDWFSGYRGSAEGCERDQELRKRLRIRCDNGVPKIDKCRFQGNNRRLHKHRSAKARRTGTTGLQTLMIVAHAQQNADDQDKDDVKYLAHGYHKIIVAGYPFNKISVPVTLRTMW